MLPGYDPHNKKYYVTSVFYHKTGVPRVASERFGVGALYSPAAALRAIVDTSDELKSDGQCDMDHIYDPKPPNKAPEKDPVQTMLEGHWRYVVPLPSLSPRFTPTSNPSFLSCFSGLGACERSSCRPQHHGPRHAHDFERYPL